MRTKSVKHVINLTRSPLDNQSGDSGLNSRHGHRCDESNTSDCAHGHGAQNSAGLPRSALQNHLETQFRVSHLRRNLQQTKQSSIKTHSQVTCVSPCWPAAVASLGTAVMILPGVPVVITFVVRMVIGVFMPALLVTPARTKALKCHSV